MKILYLTIWNFDKKESDGVAKKILQQVDTFRNSGIETDYTYILKNEKKVCVNVLGKEKIIGKYRKIKGIESCLILKEYLRKTQYTDVYFRNPGRIDPWVISLLKLLHKQGSKILYEIPTFPYDMELTSSFHARIDLRIDRFFRKEIKKYVNKVVTYSSHKMIYGVSTIRIINGIVVDKVKLVEGDDLHQTINLVAVGIFQKAHGYERIIKGLYEYYKVNGERDIIFHMVGYGEQLDFYQNMVRDLNLENRVWFYGKKSGKELDEIFEKMDIALSCFGFYKNNIQRSSALKVREYLARGMPIVTGCYEDVRDVKETDYILTFPNDNAVVSIERIVQFYDDIYKCKRNRKDIHKEIREYAEEIIDIKRTMCPIIKYLTEDKNGC